MKNYHYFFLISTMFVLANCGDTGKTISEADSTQSESRQSVSNINNLTDIDTLNLKPASSNCSLNQFLKDPSIVQLAKDIYQDNNWDLNNDTEALAMLDSLDANNLKVRPFYFKAVTMSYKKADGYFSEGLGASGKAYVENNTKEFAGYFDNKDCFTDDDLSVWSNIVMLELAIVSENTEDQFMAENFNRTIETNCAECSDSEKVTIKKFIKLMEQNWSEYLKASENQK